VLGVGLVFFLVLLAAIATLGHVSGADFNPGVSLSFFPPGTCRPATSAPTGRRSSPATLAALLLLVIWPAHPADLGATVPGIPVGRALIIEMVLTALLMLVIVSVATGTRAVGAPLNTARSFGPALASGQWQDFWVYIVGPLLGAPLGALTYEYVHGEHPQNPLHHDHAEKEEPDGDRPVRLPA
jgi:aquaporin NIP